GFLRAAAVWTARARSSRAACCSSTRATAVSAGRAATCCSPSAPGTEGALRRSGPRAARFGSAQSDLHDLDVTAGEGRERLEIVGIGCRDLVAVLGDEDERRVYRIGASRAREQRAGRTP